MDEEVAEDKHEAPTHIMLMILEAIEYEESQTTLEILNHIIKTLDEEVEEDKHEFPTHIMLMILEALEYEESQTTLDVLNQIIETLNEEVDESYESKREESVERHFEVGKTSGAKEKGKGTLHIEESEDGESEESVERHFEVGETSGVKKTLGEDKFKSPKQIFTSTTEEYSNDAGAEASSHTDGEDEEQEHMVNYQDQ